MINYEIRLCCPPLKNNIGYMEDEAFVEWRDEATQKRDLCLAGGLERMELIAWIDRTSRRRG